MCVCIYNITNLNHIFTKIYFLLAFGNVIHSLAPRIWNYRHFQLNMDHKFFFLIYHFHIDDLFYIGLRKKLYIFLLKFKYK